VLKKLFVYNARPINDSGEVFSAGPEVQQSAVPIWVTKLTVYDNSIPKLLHKAEYETSVLRNEAGIGERFAK
jgi:hypothetical protein